MIRRNITRIGSTSIKFNNSIEGETIETKIERITGNNEPITDGAPIIYTDRRDGVLASCDVRTDRWDIAIDATDLIQKNKAAEREKRHKEPDGKTEPTPGTESGQSTEPKS